MDQKMEPRFFKLMELVREAKDSKPDGCGVWISTGRRVRAVSPDEAGKKALNMMLRKKNVNATEVALKDTKDRTIYIYEGKCKYLKEPRVIQRTFMHHDSNCEEDGDPKECAILGCKEEKTSHAISRSVHVKLLSSFQIN